jgi:hypothetical protein
VTGSLFLNIIEAVDYIVQQNVPLLTSVFLGKVEPFYIAAAHLIFDALCKEGVGKVDWDQTIQEGAPKMTSNHITEAVSRLVERNVLSYVGPYDVSLHFRSLKWAYLNYVRNHSGVERRCTQALNLYK